MKVNNRFSNFIHDFFYKYSCFSKCYKSADETLIPEENKNINQRYVALLDKEYSSFISNKNRDKTRFINRIINEWEFLLESGFKNTNIENFQHQQRYSKFATLDEDIYLKNFFIPLSESVYNLIKTTTTSLQEKTNIIRYAINNLPNSEYMFTEEQINFASELFTAILDYTCLNDYIRKSIKLNTVPAHTENHLDIHNLFIDGNKLYKDIHSYKLNINNKGPFIFEYNYRYIERCTRGFCYMLHNRINKKNSRVTLQELQNTNAILGGRKLSKNKTKFIELNPEFNVQILSLLTIGYISSAVYNGKSWVKCNKEQLENLISNILKTDIFLDNLDEDTESYRLSKAHYDPNNINITKKYLAELDNICGTENLHQVLSGVDKSCILKYNFYLTNKGTTYISTNYIYDIPKLEVAEKLLNSYYTMIEKTDNKIDIIRLATWICSSLENIHPFSSANTRTVFYILLPILLYENNIWLTRSLYNNWQQLSLLISHRKYTQILNLCTDLPKIALDLTWDHNISLNEKFRILCATGDVDALQQLFKKTPRIIGESIFVSPDKPKINAVEFALLYGQKEVIELLLSYPQWEVSKQYLINMHQIYKNKDVCYYNQEIDTFLEKYI